MFRLPGDKVALIPIQDPERIGNIWVPDTAKQRTDQGVVKYVGPECHDFYPGQFVIFNGYSGTVLNVQDPERPNALAEQLIIVREKFIYAAIEDTPFTVIPGLYFKDRVGEYFEASYETALDLIADAVRAAGWRQFDPVNKQGINVVTQPPSQEEYDGVIGG